MKNHIEKFYINNFCIINDEKEIELGDFSQIKRRLSNIDKIAISAINKIYTDDVEYMVFSSRYGQIERLDKIIQEYKENNEVSPIKFSGSVHNYSLALFNLIKQIDTPYNAISSGKNSISASIIEAFCSRYNKILVCYADYFQNNIGAISFILSKNEGMTPVEFEISGSENNFEFGSFADFLNEKVDIFSSEFCTVKRLVK